MARERASWEPVPLLSLKLLPAAVLCSALRRRWVIFVDERNVPLASDDSNYKAAHAELLRKVGGCSGAAAFAIVGGVEPRPLCCGWGDGAAAAAADPASSSTPSLLLLPSSC